MVAEEIRKIRFNLRAYSCPSCGKSDRWEPLLTVVSKDAIEIGCVCGLGVLRIEVEGARSG